VSGALAEGMSTATRYFARDLLRDEVAVITGGSGGLGLAIGIAFASVGCDVALSSRSPERLAAAASQLTTATGRLCTTLVCDVRDEESVGALREHVEQRYGPATIVVNNAAANFPMPAERMPARAFSTVVDIDLYGTFHVTRAFVGSMIERQAGAVLNLVVPEADRGFEGYAHAGAAKAAIISLTRTWAREWGRHGIRVNAIGPGPVPTQGVEANMQGLLGDLPDGRFATNEELFARAIAKIPLGRLGAAEEIAAAAVFLCSPAASWITGVSLAVDGGMTVGGMFAA
jgi:NAD(P)-dependent dehydrogenase (short-subunit alcohol dehydrogenase family)